MQSFEPSAIDSAYTIFLSAAQMVRDSLGPQDTMLVWCLNELGKNRACAWEMDTALAYALQMKQIADSAHPGNIKLHVYSTQLVGDLYRELTEWTKSHQIYTDMVATLRACELSTSEEWEWLVHALLALARSESWLGGKHDERPLRIQFEALDVLRKHCDTTSAIFAGTLQNIGWRLQIEEDYDRSLEYLTIGNERAAETYGPLSQQIVWGKSLVANIYILRGDFDSADSLMQEVFAILDQTGGKSHPRIPIAMAMLAMLAGARGDIDSARVLASEMRDICGGQYPAGSAVTVQAEDLLAMVEVAAARPNRWAEIVSGATKSRQSYLRNILRYTSEALKLSCVRRFPVISSVHTSAALALRDSTTSRVAIESIINGKGLAVDVLASERVTAYCSADPYLDSLQTAHTTVCESIARIATSNNKGRADLLLPELYDRKGSLEARMTEACVHLSSYTDTGSVSLRQLTNVIDDHSVLIDIVKYERYDYDNLFLDQKNDSAYVAAIVDGTGVSAFVDLGDATTIDNLILKYRNDLTNSSRLSYQETARELYSTVVDPVSSFLEGKNEIYLSPDGLLTLVPLETLISDEGRYLIEDYQFSYLTSGRDLVTQSGAFLENEPVAIVIADPDFMSEVPPDVAFATIENLDRFVSRGSPECLTSMFTPLPMTGDEGIAITQFLRSSPFSDVHYYSSEKASETCLKNMTSSPALLHLATHGYYCEGSDNTMMSNPLLRSGLILAGANRTIAGTNDDDTYGDDGILTALEVSGLNLLGTDLVVLSACQTGVGDVMSGEGVFGLRRAFQHAGAESIIMSLFDVPDDVTMILMTSFYENWLSGESKSSALRNASLSLLSERRAKGLSVHPAYWGGFIFAGGAE